MAAAITSPEEPASLRTRRGSSGVQNLLCAYLAATVLAGLLANTLLGRWWLDPAIGLGIAASAV